MTLQCLRFWIDLFIALLTPTIAIAAAVIAYRQTMISNNQLKRDLFNDRMKLFNAAIDVIVILFTAGKITDDEKNTALDPIVWTA